MSAAVLVLGGTGRLGRATTAELEQRGRAFDAPPTAAFDLTDRASIAVRIDTLRPAAVINLAAFTDVAAAERPENKDAAIALNAELPGALAAACARHGIPFVHVSTDYVFNGAKASPYLEDDPVDPLQVYGVTKLDGERAVFASDPHALILRVSTLYGPGRPHRPAYVDAILAQARAHAAKGGGTIEVVEVPVSSPTYAPDVAPVLIDLLDRGVTGILHTVNDGAASRLELATAVAAIAGFGDRVAVMSKPEPPNALLRPAYSVLGTSKLHGLLGHGLPPWKDGLMRYLAELQR